MGTIEERSPSTWQELQVDVARIMREAGFETQVESSVHTARGRATIDVVAVDRDGAPVTTFFFECKHWRRRVPRSVVRSFRVVVEDYGANGGWIIALSGSQRGAREATNCTSIKCLTYEEFQDLFAVRWYRRYFVPQLEAAHDHIAALSFGISERPVAAAPDGLMPLDNRYRGLELVRVECSREPGAGDDSTISNCRERLANLPLDKSQRLFRDAPLRTILRLLLQTADLAEAEYQSIYRGRPRSE